MLLLRRKRNRQGENFCLHTAVTSHTELLCCPNTKHNCKSKVKGESEDTAEPTACLYVKKKAVPYAGFNSLSQVITIRLKDNLEPKLQSVNT